MWILPCLAGIAAHFNCLQCGFISYDDPTAVSENPQVLDGLTWESLQWAMTTTHFANWMPLTWLSYMLDVEGFGVDPFGFHLTNLILHLGSTLLVTQIAHRLSGQATVAMLAAVLFACHPIQVQAVTWIAERKGMLSSFFWLAAIAAYLAYAAKPSLVRYLAVTAMLLLSLLAKQMAVTFVFGLWIIDFLFLDRFSIGIWKSITTTRVVWEKLPWLFLSLACIAAGAYAQHDHAALKSVDAYPLMFRLNTAATGIIHYIVKLIDLAHIQFHYHAYTDFNYWVQLAMSTVLLAALLYGAYRFRIRSRYPLFACLWLIISIAPVSGIIQIGFQRMADRYAYVPLLGFYLLIATAVTSTWLKKHLGSGLQTTLAIVLVTISMWRSVAETAYWTDSERLYERALAIDPRNPVAFTNLGDYYQTQEQYQLAIEYQQRALREFPDRHHVLHQLGAAHAALGDSDKAIEYFQQSIDSVTGGYPEAENSLAMEYTKRKQYELAKAIFTRHTQRFPRNSRAFGNLAACLYRQGDLTTAENAYKVALSLRADVPNWTFHLGRIKYEQRQFADAKKWFERTLIQVPQSAEVWRAKAFTEFHLDRQAEGRDSIQQWFRLEGATPLNRNQLAYLLLQSKQADRTQLDSLVAVASSSGTRDQDGDANSVERWFNLVSRLQEPDAVREQPGDSPMQMPSEVGKDRLDEDFIFRTEWNGFQSQQPFSAE